MELKRRLVCAVLLLTLAAACGEATTPSATAELQTLRLDLQTPHLDDGAVVLTVVGPDLSDPQPASPAYLLYSADAGVNRARIIVVGNLKAGPLMTFAIGPDHQLADYSASVEQVAARTDTLRATLSEYQLRVTVP